FIYDVWGDTVNMASRMESLGAAGRIQVTHTVRDRLGDAFEFESRGLIEVKGKGPTATYFLTGRPAPSRATAQNVHRAPTPTA
ncbi:MAG: adenylate/guanylate cyclase domain-containing protein, partial [Candidatus Limnocylindrales bacterium]